MIEQYQMEGSEYIFLPARKYVFFTSPFKSTLLSIAEELFMAVTYTGNNFFPYLLNIVTFSDDCITRSQEYWIDRWIDSLLKLPLQPEG